MHATINGERTLTELDFTRLGKLPEHQLPPGFADLLAGAEIRHARAIDPDIVTMNSRIELVDLSTRRRQVLTVCYPEDAAPAAGLISVLSPVGSSLLGLRVGDVAKWRTPHGDECAAELAAIQFQPEAAGDYAS